MQNSNEAMREALKELQFRLVAGVYDGSIDCHEALEVVDKALALPRRNCDVGTAKNQSDRLKLYCDEYGRYCDGSPKCNDCPLLEQIMTNGGKCELMWAQMPYVEGENDGV